jgi:hypothetical protein
MTTQARVLVLLTVLVGCAQPGDVPAEELQGAQEELRSFGEGAFGGGAFDPGAFEPPPAEPIPVGVDPCPECGFVYRGSSASTPLQSYRIFSKLRWTLAQLETSRVELVYRSGNSAPWTTLATLTFSGAETQAQFIYPNQSVPLAARYTSTASYALRYVPTATSSVGVRTFMLREIYESAYWPYSPGGTVFDPAKFNLIGI